MTPPQKAPQQNVGPKKTLPRKTLAQKALPQRFLPQKSQGPDLDSSLSDAGRHLTQSLGGLPLLGCWLVLAASWLLSTMGQASSPLWAVKEDSWVDLCRVLAGFSYVLLLFTWLMVGLICGEFIPHTRWLGLLPLSSSAFLAGSLLLQLTLDNMSEDDEPRPHTCTSPSCELLWSGAGLGAVAGVALLWVVARGKGRVKQPAHTWRTDLLPCCTLGEHEPDQHPEEYPEDHIDELYNPGAR